MEIEEVTNHQDIMKVIAAAFILLATALVDTAPAGGPSKHQQRHLRQIIDSAKALLKDEDLPSTKEVREDNLYVEGGWHKSC